MGLLDDLPSREPSPTPPAPAATPPRTARHGVALDLAERKVFLTAGESEEFPFVVKNAGTEDDTVVVRIETLPPLQEEASEAAEWGVRLLGVLPRKEWDVTFSREFQKEVDLIAGGEREVTLRVICPRGARYGDQLQVIVNVASKNDAAVTDSRRVTALARQAILAVKTSIGYERVVTDSIAARAKSVVHVAVFASKETGAALQRDADEVLTLEEAQAAAKDPKRSRALTLDNDYFLAEEAILPEVQAAFGASLKARRKELGALPKEVPAASKKIADLKKEIPPQKSIGVFAILAPDNSRGYIYVESMNPDRLEEVARSIRRTRGIVKGQARMDDIQHYLTPKPLVSGIMEGDIVELVAGPFKGEKARVQKIDEAKEEITVELFEAMVPIPVTVRGDNVRVLAKEEK
jgi:transcriptional antiterminator NusG